MQGQTCQFLKESQYVIHSRCHHASCAPETTVGQRNEIKSEVIQRFCKRRSKLSECMQVFPSDMFIITRVTELTAKNKIRAVVFMTSVCYSWKH